MARVVFWCHCIFDDKNSVAKLQPVLIPAPGSRWHGYKLPGFITATCWENRQNDRVGLPPLHFTAHTLEQFFLLSVPTPYTTSLINMIERERKIHMDMTGYKSYCRRLWGLDWLCHHFSFSVNIFHFQNLERLKLLVFGWFFLIRLN